MGFFSRKKAEVEENNESKITKSNTFKIKNSIPLNNFISQSQRFGEPNFGTRLFIYNQYKNKMSITNINTRNIVINKIHITKRINVISMIVLIYKMLYHNRINLLYYTI